VTPEDAAQKCIQQVRIYAAEVVLIDGLISDTSHTDETILFFREVVLPDIGNIPYQCLLLSHSSQHKLVIYVMLQEESI